MSVQVPNGGIQVILDPGTWAWLQMSMWVTIALALGMICAIVWHFISEFRTPLESKGIRDASHGKKPGLILVGDDGVAEWKTPQRIGHEGYTVTKPEGKWKFHWTGLFPRPGKVSDSIEVQDKKDLDKTRLLASYINELNTRKIFFRGARVPVWVGIKSKAVLANICAIAGIQMTEQLARSIGDQFVIDVSALKKMVVSSSYNQSQINAVESDSEHIGEERAKKGEMLNKWVLIAGIAFGVMGLVGGILLGMMS
jgi:hypothetical protein